MIQVQDYNPEWPQWFEQLCTEIWPAVQKHALKIEHVGSTSVPGLAAKPIIDLDIVVENEDHLTAVIEALKAIGYEHLGNMGIEGREAFRFRRHQVKHNLYACQVDCTALKNHLTLRNHLRQDPDGKVEYSALKKRLATEFHDSIDQYIEGKTEFILGILKQYDLTPKELAAIEDANRAPSLK